MKLPPDTEVFIPANDVIASTVDLKSYPRLKVLLLKPYQKVVGAVQSPQMGILYLTSAIRERFQQHVDIRILDMKLEQMPAENLLPLLKEFQPDVVGMSALNYEAQASYRIAKVVKAFNKKIVTVVGGPFALNAAEKILQEEENIDWVFEGPADRVFPEALVRLVLKQELDVDLPGFSHRLANGQLHIAKSRDFVQDLDTLPMPAWDLVDFDRYAKHPNHAANLKGKRYSPLFTSRGCPYLCSYCHDIFTKRFVYHSAERVIAEIEHLYTNYGVNEFHIEDDIFNLHKPRVHEIMGEVARRWPGKMKFAFPNGLRGDIIDQEIVDVMCDAGAYAASIAIETVTPRLQRLVEKNLDVEKAHHAIKMFTDRGLQVTAAFMLGFPTETKEEIKASIDFALKSDLTLAFFFTVIPQPGTPLFDLALSEHEAITRDAARVDSGSYRANTSWYERVYGYRLSNAIRIANLRFYTNPRRIVKILRFWSPARLWQTFKVFVEILLHSPANA
ncbi:MAG: radical SAM protein [Pseudomonadales bacterium]